jgi:hypothetical protein
MSNPNITWSPGFDGRWLPGAYINTFFEVKGILPKNENVCMWLKIG